MLKYYVKNLDLTDVRSVIIVEWGKTKSKAFEYRLIDKIDFVFVTLPSRKIRDHITEFCMEASPEELFEYLYDMGSSPQMLVDALEQALK